MQDSQKKIDDQEALENLKMRIEVFRESGGTINAFLNQDVNAGVSKEALYQVLNEEMANIISEYKKQSKNYNLLEKTTKLLSACGAKYEVQDINGLDANGNGIIHYIFGNKEMLQFMKEHYNIEINTLNLAKENAAMKAAEYGRSESFQYLVENGANLKQIDIDGKNIFHKVAIQFKARDEQGQMDAVKYMMAKDMELCSKLLNTKDKNDKLPADYAKQNPQMMEDKGKLLKIFETIPEQTNSKDNAKNKYTKYFKSQEKIEQKGKSK